MQRVDSYTTTTSPAIESNARARCSNLAGDRQSLHETALVTHHGSSGTLTPRWQSLTGNPPDLRVDSCTAGEALAFRTTMAGLARTGISITNGVLCWLLFAFHIANTSFKAEDSRLQH